MSPEDVAALFEQEGSGVPQDSYDETSEAPDARQRRTALLSQALATCRELWELQSPDLALVAQKIGDGSRDGKPEALSRNAKQSCADQLENETPC